jgi:hypothetical protein
MVNITFKILFVYAVGASKATVSRRRGQLSLVLTAMIRNRPSRNHRLDWSVERVNIIAKKNLH